MCLFLIGMAVPYGKARHGKEADCTGLSIGCFHTGPHGCRKWGVAVESLYILVLCKQRGLRIAVKTADVDILAAVQSHKLRPAALQQVGVSFALLLER